MKCSGSHTARQDIHSVRRCMSWFRAHSINVAMSPIRCRSQCVPVGCGRVVKGNNSAPPPSSGKRGTCEWQVAVNVAVEVAVVVVQHGKVVVKVAAQVEWPARNRVGEALGSRSRGGRVAGDGQGGSGGGGSGKVVSKYAGTTVADDTLSRRWCEVGVGRLIEKRNRAAQRTRGRQKGPATVTGVGGRSG